ncbi:tryptophan 2,3-dioxygenase [Actinosynnema mirum]|uniref:Tryptophan 2,3-dioxygenase n=1 Tax=Actinosynnema mirum (strain ATCC 29888 / DSM 43827 / JCM 3225 / NBRC 14064 / NCIMB 13271 / NRRL B-12336 / IMRU 3971 / 101) TaxID=446462 RepID=C6WFN6_ACTMD|nr:tryptophan 2,3-dioxygenase family protein [Actinosynnema mirum]ACU35971.1 tryptophan 23-dioxygenase [Actinosynnema mirum DSM 43827]
MTAPGRNGSAQASPGTGDAEHDVRVMAPDGCPITDVTGTSTPYIDYQSIDVLLSLQRPRSDTPAELTFYVIGQVKELLFKLIHEELERTRALIDGDSVAEAAANLRRVRRVVELLNETWNVLSTLTPNEFNGFRDVLGKASGLQSYMYRMVEYALGNKVAALAQPHRQVPHVHAQVQRALREPSVYDAALRLLARRGAALPESVLDRDFSRPYEPNGAVERAWADVYRGNAATDPLPQLAEALMDVAEGFSRWRSLHLLTVERVIGFKPGTGGTEGAGWLRRVAEHRFFPELWTCRGLL